MAPDPLSPSTIISKMAEALPTQTTEDTTSALSSSYEALALFAHACMKSLSFRLLGFSESHKDAAEHAAIAPRLSAKWIQGYGSHTFVYAHEQSSMEYVIKVDRLGQKVEIRGVGLGDEKIARFEIVARDFVSNNALPIKIPVSAEGEDRSGLEAKLREVFINESRIKDLVDLFRGQIVQKLVPSLRKDGYEENDVGAREAERVRDQREEDHARRGQAQRDPLRDDRLPQPARPYPFDDPLAAAPRRPVPGGEPIPGFDDEYDLNRPAGGIGLGGRGPFNIGHDDLNPPGLGPHDPLRGSFVGGGGLPRPGGGGMHPTFDDPLFSGRGGQGNYGPTAPPGARYDPLGPGDGPQRGGNGRFPGGPGSTGGRPPNPFGGFGSGDFI
jgi:hypothetical protein